MLESLDELRTFVAVAEEGSLSVVARRLAVSVNAISRRLAQLESRLGTRLALRTTRRLTLTDEGQRLLARSRRILREVEEVEDELRPTAERMTGVVRVALHPQLSTPATLSRFAELMAEEPGLTLQVMARNAPADPIAEGFDLVVWPGPVRLQSVVARKLATLDWALAASPTYMSGRPLPRHPRDLVKHECLRVLRPQPETTWRLRHHSGKSYVAPVAGRFSSDDTATLHAAIQAGLGIGLRPRREVQEAASKGALVHVLPHWGFGDFPVYLVSPPGRLRLARVRAVANLIEAGVDQLL
ncbi:MAG: LysR substrate-binding domain-containing protein [Deltaproteobacteria bacterium]|nr:LysR substrate-binding domain-containing protein [Deltaproteobacteria bacterium]